MNGNMILTWTFVVASLIPITPESIAEQTRMRRELRAAMYPYIPLKASVYWKVESAFEEEFPAINLKYVDLGYDYYGGELEQALQNALIDVAEVDTILLEKLASEGLITPLDESSLLPAPEAFLEFSLEAARFNGDLYGVPHWICGNFLFYDLDDPEAWRFETCDTLLELEMIIGKPTSFDASVLLDMRGSSTLGEKYIDAVVDKYPVREEALKYATTDSVDEDALEALNRLFRMTPGGLCDSEHHHEYTGFYARSFSRKQARVMIGYSERLHFVIDEYFYGIREGLPSRGRNQGKGIGVVSAPLSDRGSQHLAWVDILSCRSGMDAQTAADAEAFVSFLASLPVNKEILIPEWGEAPVYLLPARKSLYTDPEVVEAAPLYPRLLEAMGTPVTLSGIDLNESLRDIGKSIEANGFKP
jgi:thiamine pyridinylase